MSAEKEKELAFPRDESSNCCSGVQNLSMMCKALGLSLSNAKWAGIGDHCGL